jgi:Spy/CpxP family protein refolding chaperone
MDGCIMKITDFFLCLLLLVLAPTALWAQDRHQMSKKSPHFIGTCLSTADLELTAEQRTAIQKNESQYGDKINHLQNRIMGKRLEVQQVFKDPHADESMIREKAREVEDLQNQCRQMMLDYQLALRAVLSPEQLRLWCAPMEPCSMKWGGKTR